MRDVQLQRPFEVPLGVGAAAFPAAAWLYSVLFPVTVEDVLTQIEPGSVVVIDPKTLSSTKEGTSLEDWLTLGFFLCTAVGVIALYLPRSNQWFKS